jgi:hypothetical protein
MPWLKLNVEKGKSLGTSTSEQTVTVDLPTSHAIGGVGFRLQNTGTTPTITVARVRLVADGNATLLDCEGGELRGLLKFETGSVNMGTNTSPATWHGYILGGRVFHDEEVAYPAGFSSLQLQLTLTNGGTITSTSMDVWVDQLVNGRPKYAKRIVHIGTTASAANATIRQRIPLGNGLLRAIYIHSDDDDNAGGGNVRVLVNGGSEVPVSVAYDHLVRENKLMYRFNDEDVPDELELVNDADGGTAAAAGEKLVKIDFDVLENLAQARRLDRDSGITDLQVEVVCAGSGTSGDVAFLIEELFAL